MRKLRFFTVLFMCSLSAHMFAQDSFSSTWMDQSDWEETRYSALIIGAQAGYSGFLYKSSNARMLSSFGGSVSLLYHYGLNKNWSYSIGAEFRHLQGRCQIDHYQSVTPHTDLEGEAFLFETVIEGYTERQSSFGISIPFSVTAYFNRFFISAGALVHIPIQAQAYSEIAEIHTSAYYPTYDVRLQNLPELGFISQQAWKNSFRFKLPAMYGPRLEIGFQTPMSDRSVVRISLMFNYTFGFVKNSLIGPFVDYASNNDGTLIFRPSVYNVDAVKTGTNRRYPIHHLEAGIRIAFGFGSFGSNSLSW